MFCKLSCTTSTCLLLLVVLVVVDYYSKIKQNFLLLWHLRIGSSHKLAHCSGSINGSQNSEPARLKYQCMDGKA